MLYSNLESPEKPRIKFVRINEKKIHLKVLLKNGGSKTCPDKKIFGL